MPVRASEQEVGDRFGPTNGDFNNDGTGYDFVQAASLRSFRHSQLHGDVKQFVRLANLTTRRITSLLLGG